MTTADVGKHRALEIDPEEYLSCSELPKKVCPVFAEVQLDEQQLRTQWLDRAVPTDDDVGVTATEHAVGNATEHDGVVATEHGGVAATEHESMPGPPNMSAGAAKS